jgi:hypothetical protein
VISVIGSHNILTKKDFIRRLDEAANLTKRLFGTDELEKWGTRLQSVSICISDKNWAKIQTLPKEELMEVIEGMIKAGAPLDDPLRNVIGFTEG